MAKFSAVITVFNGEEHVSEAVRSILDQTHRDLELIVVDDGSTDATASILASLSDDERVRILSLPRTGRAKALNLGVKSSRGEYVAILDADDVALPKRLEVQEQALESGAGGELVGSRYRVVIDRGSTETGVEDSGTNTPEEIVSALRRLENPMFHSSIAYRRSLFDRLGGYDTSLGCLIDWDFFIRAAGVSRLRNVDDRLSLKRKHEGQYFWTGSSGLRKRTVKRALAKVHYRSVTRLGAPPINLLKSVGLYLTALLPG